MRWSPPSRHPAGQRADDLLHRERQPGRGETEDDRDAPRERPPDHAGSKRVYASSARRPTSHLAATATSNARTIKAAVVTKRPATLVLSRSNSSNPLTASVPAADLTGTPQPDSRLGPRPFGRPPCCSRIPAVPSGGVGRLVLRLPRRASGSQRCGFPGRTSGSHRRCRVVQSVPPSSTAWTRSRTRCA
jgi:hypothetical protein